MFLILLIGVFFSVASFNLAAAGDRKEDWDSVYLKPLLQGCHLTSMAIGHSSTNGTPVNEGSTPLMIRGNSSFPGSQDSTASPPSLQAPPVIMEIISLNAAEVKVLFEQASKSCRASAKVLQIKAGRENCFAKLAVAILHKIGKTGPEIDHEKAMLYLKEAYPDLLSYKENILEVQLYWHDLLIQHGLLLTCPTSDFCR